MKQISISAFCKKQNLTEDEVKQKIRNNELQGGPRLGVWYVCVNETTGIEPSAVLKEPAKNIAANHTPKQLIKLSTLDYITDKEIAELGLISASSVQSVNIIKTIGAEIRSQTIGGNSDSLSHLMESAREDSLKRLQAKAYEVKADAVIGIRITTSEVLQRGVEVMAYGTAVKIVNQHL